MNGKEKKFLPEKERERKRKKERKERMEENFENAKRLFEMSKISLTVRRVREREREREQAREVVLSLNT